MAMFQAKVKQTLWLSQLLKRSPVDSNSSFQADKNDRIMWEAGANAAAQLCGFQLQMSVILLANVMSSAP